MIFLKQRYYEAGGRSAKWLAYKLKKQQAENTIYKMKDPTTNSTHCKIKDIQQSFESFYKKWYTQPEIDKTKMEAFFESINLPKVGEEQN